MSIPDFSAQVARHREYFRTGATRSADWREGQLTALRAMMTDRAEDFYAALWTDLGLTLTLLLWQAAGGCAPLPGWLQLSRSP